MGQYKFWVYPQIFELADQDELTFSKVKWKYRNGKGFCRIVKITNFKIYFATYGKLWLRSWVAF